MLPSLGFLVSRSGRNLERLRERINIESRRYISDSVVPLITQL